MNAPAKQNGQQMQQQSTSTNWASGFLQSDRGQKMVERYATEGVSVDQIKRTALWLYNHGDDNLKEAPKAQIIEAVLQSFHDGIDLTQGEGHLICYGDDVDYRIDYKGLVRKAKESPHVANVDADIVRENESFRKWRDADGLHFEHECKPFGGGQMVGAYCVVYRAGGGIEKVEALDMHDLDTIKRKSGNPYKSDQWSSTWDDFPAEMAKKAATRRALKWVDTSPEVGQMLHREQVDTYQNAGPSKTPQPAQVDATQSVAALEQQFTPDDSGDDGEADDWALADMRAMGDEADQTVEMLVSQWGESDARRIVEDMALRRQCDPAELSDEDFGELYEEYLCSDSGMSQLEMKAL